MKKTIFIAITILILGISISIMLSDKNSNIGQYQESKISQLEDQKQIELIIDNGKGLSLTYIAKFREGMTVFDLLKEKTDELHLNLETKIYDVGTFIEAIGNKKNGKENKYWLYYVNGEMPMVAVEQNKLNPGDTVEFKFEESSF